MYTLEDYNYHLPEDLIAQTPADPPESCKFLIYDKATGQIQDTQFSGITKYIDPDTLIVFNNSKVVKARIPLPAIKGEIFYLQSQDEFTFSALVRPGKRFKIGDTIQLNDEVSFMVDALTEDGRLLTCSHPIKGVLETYGQMPLPPYISYDESKVDPYQPIFAEKEGSVAAPTASLHFTKELIKQLKDKGVKTAYTTLHVGLGTFKQVDVEDITTYNIHSETIEVATSLFDRLASHKNNKKPLLAVGTTVTRTLESLPYLWKVLEAQYPEVVNTCDQATRIFWQQMTENILLEEAKNIANNIHIDDGTIIFASELFLYPGQTFFLIDELITNFHLPKSSLLMLVAGLVGYEQMKNIYAHAIEQQYRFYSFGDAMWLK